jgi:hypothetical protein
MFELTTVAVENGVDAGIKIRVCSAGIVGNMSASQAWICAHKIVRLTLLEAGSLGNRELSACELDLELVGVGFVQGDGDGGWTKLDGESGCASDKRGAVTDLAGTRLEENWQAALNAAGRDVLLGQRRRRTTKQKAKSCKHSHLGALVR